MTADKLQLFFLGLCQRSARPCTRQVASTITPGRQQGNTAQFTAKQDGQNCTHAEGCDSCPLVFATHHKTQLDNAPQFFKARKPASVRRQ